MNSPTKYLLLGMLLLCAAAKAQSPSQPPADQRGDYIVTHKGDTVYCELTRNIWGYLQYKSPEDIAVKKIDTTEIAAYYLKKYNLTYKAFVLPDKQQRAFLQLIECGKINLYRLTVFGYTEKVVHLYADKKGQPLTEIKNTRYLTGNDGALKERFTGLISDNENVLKQYTVQQKFDSKTIRDLVHMYNSGS